MRTASRGHATAVNPGRGPPSTPTALPIAYVRVCSGLRSTAGGDTASAVVEEVGKVSASVQYPQRRPPSSSPSKPEQEGITPGPRG